jgi:hypothetical protein
MCIGGCGACCFAADVTSCFTGRKIDNVQTMQNKEIIFKFNLDASLYCTFICCIDQ